MLEVVWRVTGDVATTFAATWPFLLLSVAAAEVDLRATHDAVNRGRRNPGGFNRRGRPGP